MATERYTRHKGGHVYILAGSKREFDVFTQMNYTRFYRPYDDPDLPRAHMILTPQHLYGLPVGFRVEMLSGFLTRTDHNAEMMRTLCRERGAVLLNL